MARVGVTKKKPRATALSRVKDKLRRVTEQLESRERELAEATEHQTATAEVLRMISRSPTDVSAGARRHRRERGAGLWDR